MGCRMTRMAVAGVLVFAISGCDNGPTTVHHPGNQLKSVTIVGDTSFTAIGQTAKWAVSGTYYDGSVQDLSNVSWRSTFPDVATIDSSGTLITRGLGETTIYAQYELGVYSRKVQVTPPG